MKNSLMKLASSIALIGVSIVLSILFIGCLSYLVCFGFGLHWDWGIAVGIWALVIMLKFIFSGNSRKEGKNDGDDR